MRSLLLGTVALSFSAVAACGTGEAAAPIGPPSAPAADAPSTDAVTYHEHVAPILQKRCQSCHVSGGIAPFALTTYEEAKPMAPAIVDMTQRRIMPPWGAHETADCKPTRPWKNDLRLTDAELATLKAWDEAGAPAGDPAKAPPPSVPPSRSLADPSLTLQPEVGFAMSGTSDVLECFVLDPKLAADAFVDGIHVVPERPEVVHHVLVFVDPTGASRAKADANGRYECFGGAGVADASLLSAWAPGGPPNELPSGIGMPVAAGSLLVMQVHYHAAGGVAAPPDRTRVDLRFAKQTPSSFAVTRLVGNFRDVLADGTSGLATPPFEIPPNARDHVETMKLKVPSTLKDRPVKDLRLLAAGGHMHYVGVSEDVRIRRGDGSEECLLAIPRWDFDWQRGYVYDTPVDQLPLVVPGDELSISCTYDNTMQNPKMARALAESGQSAPQLVTLGESTLDEMCLASFTFVVTP